MRLNVKYVTLMVMGLSIAACKTLFNSLEEYFGYCSKEQCLFNCCILPTKKTDPFNKGGWQKYSSSKINP